MTDERPSHEDLDKYIRELPTEIISRLPDNTESREAKRLIDVAADLAHQAREKVKPA